MTILILSLFMLGMVAAVAGQGSGGSDAAKRAEGALAKGDNEKAIELFTEAIRADRDNVSLYTGRGKAYFAVQLIDLALADLDTALKLLPGDKHARLERCRVLAHLERFDEAIEDCDAAVGADADFLDAYQYRSGLYRIMGRLRESVADLTEAIRLAPTARNFANRAGVNAALRQGDAAIDDYSEAIKLDGENAALYASRAEIYSDRGDHAAAVADLTRLIELSGGNADAYLRRGRAYEAKGEPDSAAADYTAAARRQPFAIEPLELRCALNIKRFNYAVALEDINAVIRLKPAHAPAYQKRGMLYRLTGRRSEAIADQRKALSLDPNLKSAKDELAMMGEK